MSRLSIPLHFFVFPTFLCNQSYQLLIEYEGSKYIGWQKQKKGKSIQGTIEKILSKLLKEKIVIQGSGRTDSGVHALQQSSHFDFNKKINKIEKLIKSLNFFLKKKNISILKIKKKTKNFHARFSATAREYEYRLVKYFSPINRHFSTTLKWDVDSEKIDKCVDLLLGEHDFSSFCKANAEVNNKICTVFVAKCHEINDQFIFTIKANRFLQHMVRFLVGTIIEVGRGRYSVLDFKKLLNNESSNKTVVRAPSQGLFLKKVYND